MKKFRELLIAGISEDIEGTTVERLTKVKQTFEDEMIYREVKPSPELLTNWLQGLCSAIHVPYENHAIIEWTESTLRRKSRKHKRNALSWTTEEERWLEKYWPQLGRTLYEMLYS